MIPTLATFTALMCILVLIMGLLETRLGKGYTVYMVNFSSSPALFEDLLVQNTAASGTVHTNRRNFHKSLKPRQGQKQVRGDYLYFTKIFHSYKVV